jgi:hypothetical protein
MKSFIATAGLIDVDHGTIIPEAYVAVDGEEMKDDALNNAVGNLALELHSGITTVRD